MKTEILSILEKVKNGELTPQIAQEQIFILSDVNKRIVLSQDWFESEDSKTGWDTIGWNEPKGFELEKVLNTDKYGNPTLATFIYVL